MARKVFEHFEAVSAAIPTQGVYQAAIAVKALSGGGAPRFHAVLEGQTFKTADEADQAAAEALERLVDVDSEAALVWRPAS
ncbi:hypothetical protein IFR09_07020 [Pseudomonas syringae]|nr:hypothetical protein [Pseudomonas syringae]MBD8573429.1 hypothetical protein [Pseudomonas syringae]MBD8790118.1 hypothetical protein [Pseudomonas syringae]MBD8800093.1 hypothetical protein [Pseudomonas syringae]MBD8810911.1 hypothetical protein [Pseudomonas syringae]